mmetsp:Transcript_46296/g.121453  ORF Transcript_46296/g.121453 Transcript_46296/m.121453 type:complete len:290 (+) Transcript_46296:419-1288(+)
MPDGGHRDEAILVRGPAAHESGRRGHRRARGPGRHSDRGVKRQAARDRARGRTLARGVLDGGRDPAAGHHGHLGHCRQARPHQCRLRRRARRHERRRARTHGHRPRLWEDSRARCRARRRLVAAARLPHRAGEGCGLHDHRHKRHVAPGGQRGRLRDLQHLRRRRQHHLRYVGRRDLWRRDRGDGGSDELRCAARGDGDGWTRGAPARSATPVRAAAAAPPAALQLATSAPAGRTASTAEEALLWSLLGGSMQARAWWVARVGARAHRGGRMCTHACAQRVRARESTAA